MVDAEATSWIIESLLEIFLPKFLESISSILTDQFLFWYYILQIFSEIAFFTLLSSHFNSSCFLELNFLNK